MKPVGFEREGAIGRILPLNGYVAPGLMSPRELCPLGAHVAPGVMPPGGYVAPGTVRPNGFTETVVRLIKWDNCSILANVFG